MITQNEINALIEIINRTPLTMAVLERISAAYVQIIAAARP